MSNGLIIDPAGETVVVTITSANANASISLFADDNRQSPLTNPVTISSVTKVFVRETVQAKVSLTIGGVESSTVSGAVALYTFGDGGIGTIGVVQRSELDLLTYANATFALPVGTIVVALGDSITGNGGGPGPQSGSESQTDSKGWFGWANVLLGHCLTIYNAGKAGDTTAQMLARFDTDVTPYAPRFVFVMGGTNDAIQSVSSATTITNLTAIYTKVRALGALVVAMPVPPNNGATGAQINEALTVNRWIRDYCRANRGFIFVDVGAALYDTTTTWKFATGYNIDNNHPSALGASKMGLVLAAALRPFVPTSSDLLGQSNSDPTNLLSNPVFNGSGTTLATGWSVSGGLGAVTVSYVARTDGLPSKRMQLAVPNGNAAVSLQQNVNLSASLAVGDQCYFAVELELDTLDSAPAANTQDVRLLLQCYNGSSFTSKAYDMYWDTSYVNVPFPGTSGVLCTPALTIPSGTTLVQPVVQIQGGGNYRLSRAALRKGAP